MNRRSPLSLALLCVAAIAPATPARAAGPEWYAGIEVGSGGIKAVALPIEGGAKQDIQRLVGEIAFSETRKVDLKNTEGGRFRPDAIDGARAAVGEFFDRLTLGEPGRPKIKPSNIWVVASSGLVMNKPSNFDELARAVAEATGGARKLAEITRKRETMLLLRGAIRADQCDNAILVDIGSGNVQCGYIRPAIGLNVEQLCVPNLNLEGTVAYRKAIEKVEDVGDNFRQFCEVAERDHDAYVKGVEGEMGRFPGLISGERRRVYLSGGAPYVIACLIHPLEMARDDVAEVRLTSAELGQFLKRFKETEKVPTPSQANLTEADRSVVAALRASALKIFEDKDVPGVGNRNLMAGAEILLGFSEALGCDEEKKSKYLGRELYFTKVGLMAWLVGYVAEERAQQFPPQR